IAWGERFRLDWPPPGKTVLAHLAGIAATTLLIAIVRVLLERSLGPMHEPQGQDVRSHFRAMLVYSCGHAVITYSCTIGLGYAASYNVRTRQLLELKSELSKAQLSALRMQLNPHF